jgi:hypothetical protein
MCKAQADTNKDSAASLETWHQASPDSGRLPSLPPPHSHAHTSAPPQPGTTTTEIKSHQLKCPRGTAGPVAWEYAWPGGWGSEVHVPSSDPAASQWGPGTHPTLPCLASKFSQERPRDESSVNTQSQTRTWGVTLSTMLASLHS